MEIAIWTTVLTTVITIIQTWFMWFFTQRVKLEDSEMDELVDKLEDDIEEEDTASKSEVNNALNAVEADVADALETMLDQIDTMSDRVNGLHSVADELLSIIDDVTSRLDSLEQHVVEPVPIESVVYSGADQQAPPELQEPVRPYVEPPTQVPEIPAAKNIKERLPRTAVGMPDKRNKIKREVKPLNVYNKEDLLKDLPDEQEPEAVPAPVVEPAQEAPIKEPRGDGEPLITDLRAQPFEEHPDAYDNVHELPAFGDGFEAWGATKGRQPRPRGFRRI